MVGVGRAILARCIPRNGVTIAAGEATHMGVDRLSPRTPAFRAPSPCVVRTDADGKIVLAHGIVEYKDYLLLNDLTFLDNKGDVMVRVLHETKRWGDGCSEQEKTRFAEKCGLLQKMFPGIKFYGGLDVRTWVRYFDFGTDAPKEDGCYASNMKPRVVDDWWPWLYARLNNRKFRERGTNLDVLVLDFVEIGGEDGAGSPAQ